MSPIFSREVSELIVSVIQAKDLEVNEVTGTVDSYVKVNLAPDSEAKKITKVMHLKNMEARTA